MEATSACVTAPDPDGIAPKAAPDCEGDAIAALKARFAAPCPFDGDEAAVKEREAVDYSVRVTAEMARQGKAPRRVRVYADGIYDMFHPGHARQFMQVKNVFPRADVYLIVGVCNGAVTRERKGKTVMDDDERYEAVRHCRYVDEVLRDAPWVPTEAFFARNKIDFVAHDDQPYTIGSSEDVYAWAKKNGMFIATRRTEGVSTSDVVARIVRDYDIYIRRNLARGYSREDLNVSFLRGQRIKLANKVDEVKERLERKKDEYRQKWEDVSKDVIGAFLKLFGQREWSVDRFWSRRGAVAGPSPPPSPPPPPPAEDEREEEEEKEDDDGRDVGASRGGRTTRSARKRSVVSASSTAAAAGGKRARR